MFIMAHSKISEVKGNFLKVKSYLVNQAEILGKGAFGIVYKGIDIKENPIATKQLDVKEHPQILAQDLDRFLQLDHLNVMKILDVEKTDNNLWMMKFCWLLE